MTKPITGEKTKDETIEKQTLSEAVSIVREAIAAEENRLKQIAESQEEDPVMLEGETSANYFVQMMVDPAKVARIMLNYQYPLYKVLAEDAPQDMWDELARMVGLDTVCSVDL